MRGAQFFAGGALPLAQKVADSIRFGIRLVLFYTNPNLFPDLFIFYEGPFFHKSAAGACGSKAKCLPISPRVMTSRNAATKRVADSYNRNKSDLICCANCESLRRITSHVRNSFAAKINRAHTAYCPFTYLGNLVHTDEARPGRFYTR